MQNADGSQEIIINQEVAKKEKAVSVAQHELLHAALLNTVTNESNHFVLYIESFINLLAETMLVLGLTVLLFYFEPVITSFAIVILFMISLAYINDSVS